MDDETITTEPTPGSLIRDLLHAMGQPLTALQICVLLRDHGMSPLDSCDDLLADMAKQVTSLTRLFSSLRSLLECGSPSAAITASDVRRSVDQRLARWQKEASTRNVTLVLFGLAFTESGTKFWNVGLMHACLQDVFEAALLSSPSHGQSVWNCSPMMIRTVCFSGSEVAIYFLKIRSRCDIVCRSPRFS